MSSDGVHIGDPFFGNHIDPFEMILETVNKLPKLDSVDGRTVLQDIYETRYGIFNHFSDSKSRPLASVALHVAEDINQDSLLQSSIETYVERNIGDTFRLSITEFLDLPLDICVMLTEIAHKKIQEKNNAVSDIEREFKDIK